MSAPPPLAGQVALVTGGGSRLMGALCEELAALGAAVAVCFHRSAGPAEALADRLRGAGARAVALGADLSDPREIERLAAEVAVSLGRVGILVHGASTFQRVRAAEATAADWEQALGLEVRAPALLARALRADLTASHGVIVLMSDLAGDQGWAPWGPHSVAGAASRGLVRALAVDLAPAVRVSGLCLGLVEGEDAGPVDRVPLGRPLTLAEVRHGLRYLVEAQGLTGETLHLDGGRRARTA